jgi:hypothetical protein
MNHGISNRRRTWAVALGLLLGAGAGRAHAQSAEFNDPEQLVRGLYAAVTFGPGSGADWDHVREYFVPQAVFAVRRTATSMDVLNVDEFVAWFKADVERLNMVERGFEETVQKLKLTVFGDMAHAFVVYRARLKTPPDLPGQYGLDSFGLIRLNGRWWIASVTNDVVTRDRPLPDELAVTTPSR